MPRTVLYLTHVFPCPGDPFSSDELPFLNAEDRQVIVIPCGRQRGACAPLPLPAHARSDMRLLGRPLAKLAHILTPTALGLLWREWRHRMATGQRFSCTAAVKACAAAAFARRKLREIIRENHLEGQPLVVYSFWFSHHAAIMPLLKKEFPQLRFVSRAHGIDVYQERHPKGHLPFHGLRASAPDVAAPCSLDGWKTLRAEGVPEVRLVLAHLGVPASSAERCPPSAEGELALVSCSRMSAVKRLPLLIRRLEELARARPRLRITWHHLGDGPEGTLVRDEVERRLRPLANLSAVLHGQRTPQEVRAFLAGTACPLDALVNVSSSEGLPVSMMEALAAGLPLVGTDVGGVAELVVPETGILLPASCGSDAFLRAMDALQAWKSPEKRRHNQVFFAAHFRMENNYRRFAETILERQLDLSGERLSSGVTAP